MNRRAPAGCEVNEEETSKRTWQATLVGTGRDSDMTPDARRVVVGDQHFPEKTGPDRPDNLAMVTRVAFR